MRFLKKTVRFAAAGLTALLILTVLCSFYSSRSTHIPNEMGNTDYIWKPGSRWVYMAEGIAWGHIDEAGYNNLRVVENPDVLILGSSHMEAFNVMQEDSTASQLQSLLGDSHRVYSKGISGHDFMKVCQYLRDNLEVYETAPEYVVIETSDLSLSNEQVDQILSHTVEFTPSHTEGFTAKLQQNPFLRHGFHCLTNGWLDLLLAPRNAQKNPVEVSRISLKPTSSQSSQVLPDIDPEPYQRLFSYMDSIQKEFGTQVIIFYHPTGYLQKDGSVLFDSPAEKAVFEETCVSNHIVFLDMTEPFYEMYTVEHSLPHGFITGSVSHGHMNAHGHKAVARELFRVISELEEGNDKCR